MANISLTFEHAGDSFTEEVPLTQRIRAAFQRALTQFGINPGDADRHHLTYQGRQVGLDQSFSDAGIPDEARLRIRPRTQRNG